MAVCALILDRSVAPMNQDLRRLAGSRSPYRVVDRIFLVCVTAQLAACCLDDPVLTVGTTS
jgi:hypothetical protein